MNQLLSYLLLEEKLCKGRVDKTTVLCNLVSYLCQKMNKKILVINVDPQCNTITYILDFDSFLQVYYKPRQFTYPI